MNPGWLIALGVALLVVYLICTYIACRRVGRTGSKADDDYSDWGI